MVIWKDGNYIKTEQTDKYSKTVLYNKDSDSMSTTTTTSEKISVELKSGISK